MTEGVVNVAVHVRLVAKAVSAESLAADRVTNDVVHAVIKVKEVGQLAMIEVANAETIAAVLGSVVSHPPLCRKSTSHSCPMKEASSPWRDRSK